MKKRLKIFALSSIALWSGIRCSGGSDVTEEPKDHVITVAKVLEYAPAFGQFVHELPSYEEGDTTERMRQKAEQALRRNEVITLGGFGGYVVFAFDHTVSNVTGKRDFRILGNAFANNAEPGVIWVAYDQNKNGVPDEEEWFEIAGSEHGRSDVIRGYQITYYRPDPIVEQQEGEIASYIRWKDNQGNTGWKAKNQFHQQRYYPQWIEADSLVFEGTLLPNNALASTDNGGWQLKAFGWGYADNYPNAREGATIDIDWAVDQAGRKVQLPGIDFVKVCTGLNQEAGWLGETSTEVAGAIDLHLEEMKKHK